MVERVGIEIEAEDDTGDAFETAAGRINQLGEKADDANTGFSRLANGAQSAGRAIETGLNVMTRMDIMQITLEQSTRNVKEAQDRYNEALLQFGSTSSQAQTAAESLADAQSNLEKANIRANISNVLIVGDLVSIAAQAPKAVAGIMSVTAASTALSTSMVGLGAGALIGGLFLIDALFPPESFQAAGKSIDELEGHLADLQQSLNDLSSWDKLNDQGKRIASGRSDVQPILREIEATKRAIEESKTATETVGKVAMDAAAAFVAAENLKALATTGSEREIRAAITQSQTAMEGYARQLRNPDLQGREALQKLYDQETDKVRVLGAALTSMERTAQVAAENTARVWQEAMDATRGSFQAAGVDFTNLTNGMLQELRVVGDAMTRALAEDTMAKRADSLLALEGALAGASEETRAALLRQAAAAQDKEGNHILLNAALQDGTITEAEHKKAVAESEAALQGQAKAAMAAADAMNAALMPTWKYTGGGAWNLEPGAATQVGGTGNDAIRSIHQIDIARQGTASGPGMALLDALDARVKADPTIRSSTDFQYASAIALRAAEGRGMGANGLMSPAMVNALRNLGVRFAANGYDGMVSGPTMFIAGEAGPEHVRISPGGQDRSGGPALVVNGGVHVNVGSRTAPGPLTMAVRDGLTIPARRAASRRGY